MTLPRKPSRDIEVDGRTYRWMVRMVGPGESSVRLTVEDTETGEVRQRVFPEWGPDSDPPRVSPGRVRDFIRHSFLSEEELTDGIR